AVALETGPDEEMGIFGRLAPDGSADYVPVMRFETTTAKPLVKEMPTRLVEISAASQASAVPRRQFVVNSGIWMNRTQAGEHADMVALTGINGQTFDMERIDVETQLGTSEIWEVVSIGVAHPFHIHGALFRILSIAGAPPAPHLAGWKDVVLVGESGTSRCFQSARNARPPLHVSLPHPRARGGRTDGAVRLRLIAPVCVRAVDSLSGVFWDELRRPVSTFKSERRRAASPGAARN